MDNFNILILITILALVYIKDITKFLLNIKQIILKKKISKEHKVLILIIITVLLILYVTMMNKKDEFSQKKRTGWSFFYDNMPNMGLDDYLEGSTEVPIEHEHEIPDNAKHNHKSGGGKSNVMRHTHIMESPTNTPEPFDSGDLNDGL